MQEHDLVVLTRALPEDRLEAGDVGTVVLIHRGAAGYEVEFTTLTGETVAVLTLPPDAVRPVREREILHAREVA